MPRRFLPPLRTRLSSAWRDYSYYPRKGGGGGVFTNAEAGLLLHYSPHVIAMMELWLGREVSKEELILGLTSLRLSMEAYARGEGFLAFMEDRLRTDLAA